MENRSHALIAGLFLLAMGAALLFTVAWFQGDRGERVRYTVVTTAAVQGLNVKSSVKLRGVEVGKVQSINFDPSNPRQILVDIAIDPATPITDTTYAQLGLQGVTGLAFVALNDTGTGTRRLSGNEDTPPRIPMRPSLFDQLAEGGPAMVAGFSETARRLNGLLNDTNQQQLSRTLANLEEASGQVSKMVAGLQPTVRALPALTRHADETMMKVGVAVQHFETLADASTALAQDVRSRAGALDKLGTAADQVESTARNLELALVGADRPRNYALVEDLSRSTRAIERAAADLNEQPQSLLFGRPLAPPGPGESGFDAPRGAAR
ncbi:MAG TPA: MlaD family protein [Burkholderiaceae bacterium]|jgi:phospholipid/cholesterol/gamma-HCH transport system substrate-binding protein|nr:MlaD family protein [Burkholderiaceae bacterium]